MSEFSETDSKQKTDSKKTALQQAAGDRAGRSEQTGSSGYGDECGRGGVAAASSVITKHIHVTTIKIVSSRAQVPPGPNVQYGPYVKIKIKHIQTYLN